MKFRELVEAIEPKLKELITKHNLKSNPTGTLIDDFNFSTEIGKEFDEIGYEINFNGSKNKFVVRKKKTAAEISKEEGDRAWQVRDPNGRKVGFKPKRKSGL
jgi:hypothetical protein